MNFNEYSKGISENRLIDKIDFELSKQAKIMIPNKKFGTVFQELMIHYNQPY